VREEVEEKVSKFESKYSEMKLTVYEKVLQTIHGAVINNIEPMQKFDLSKIITIILTRKLLEKGGYTREQ
jgi:hypothetical protein